MGEPFQRERPKKDFPHDYAAHDIIGYLLDNAGELSKAHGKIAEAILHHPTMFVEKPIEDLVTWLGVSAPTITRFSRAIGCDGLRDLKLKVMSSMRVGMRYLEPVTPPETLAEAQERVVLRAQRAVLAAHQTIDAAILDSVIDALARSRMIYAFGSGGVSSWMVEESSQPVVPPRPAHHQQQRPPDADDVGGDCRTRRHRVRLFAQRQQRRSHQGGAHCCGLRRNHGRAHGAQTLPCEAVALPLTIDIADDGDVLGPTCLRYAFLVAVDMLAYGAAIRNRGQAQEKLRRIKQQFTTYRDTDDTQPVSD